MVIQGLVCANVILLVGVLVIVAAVVGHHRRSARVFVALAIGLSAAWWILFYFETGVTREMAFDMEWSYGEKWQSYPNADHIILRFKSHPNHHVGIISKDLGKYLESLPSRDVRVVFEVTLDFGSARGFREIQIGELTAWNELDGDSNVLGIAEW